MILRQTTSAIVLLVLLLTAVSPVTAVRDLKHHHAGTTPGARRWPSHAPHHHHNGHVFPFLTWLRDSTVEFVFGRPSRTAAPKGESVAERRSFEDEVVIRFNVTSQEEEQAISKAADTLFLDIWAFTRDYVDVRLHKDDIASLCTLLPKSLHTAYKVLIYDLESAALATYPTKQLHQLKPAALTNVDDGGDNIFFQDYQPMPVITRWMKLLEAMFPSIVSVISVGTSYEGRDIPALRVGEVNELSTASRKTILVTGGLHAREWISTTTVNYLAWSFITAYGKEPLVTKLLSTFDIVFVPAVNPDGVEYTWQTDRLWRKSRQHTNFRFCRGLDLDHAFGFGWEGRGTNQHAPDPCSESYGGDQPFQAVEALQLAQWARNETFNNVRFVGYLDLHSYSQQILFPFSYTCDVDPSNRENLEELAAGLSKAIRLSSGMPYGISSACEGAVTRDPSATSSKRADGPMPRVESGGGSAIDWFYHELQARYSYQIKLRDTGSYGFLLPREHIVPTGKEMYSAMKYFGDYLLGNNGIEKLATSRVGSKVHLKDDGFTQVVVAKKEKEEEEESGHETDLEIDEDGGWMELRKRRRR
jgi:extracellular matrix protein 14